MSVVTTNNGIAKKIQYDFLESGRFAVGDKLPTLVQLAKQYEVSTPTIQKAATELESQGLLRKRRGSGIFVESLPKTSRTKLGYICGNFLAPLQSHILEGINNYIADSGNNCSLEVATSQDDITNERDQVQTMQEHGVKGVIIYSCNTSKRDSYKNYLTSEFRDYPVVVVDNYSPKMCRPHVIMDNYHAGYEMTKYLLAQGRSKIAFVKFDKTFCRSVEDRFIGYKQALEEAGLPLVPEHIINIKKSNPENAVMKQLISAKPRPDAIIALFDGSVPFIINSLRSRDIAVPQDITVAGFDNMKVTSADYIHSNHTNDVWPTTKPDFTLMGEKAAGMLFGLVESKDFTASGMVLPCPLLLQEEQGSAQSRQLMSGLLK
jgi:GntR family transcriptional regulator, arabinose operon transcriptional repressor